MVTKKKKKQYSNTNHNYKKYKSSPTSEKLARIFLKESELLSYTDLVDIEELLDPKLHDIKISEAVLLMAKVVRVLLRQEINRLDNIRDE